MYFYKKLFKNSLTSLKSKKVFSKILVFESDDWGSIRTPSLAAAAKVKKMGGFTPEPAYLMVDTLENERDLRQLLEVLKGHKDLFGNSAILTANYVMANPDFNKIRAFNFKSYYYETFVDTYHRYFGENNILSIIKNKDNLKVFYPQFHGREHVNIPLWLSQLKQGDKVFMTAFDEGFYGVQTHELQLGNRNVQATYELPFVSPFLEPSIKEGLQLFYEIFGFYSRSFIPNNYVWLQSWNQRLFNQGVQFLQGVRLQAAPLNNLHTSKRDLRKRWGGQVEQGGLISIVRNGSFEPSFTKFKAKEALEMCLNDIKIAFLLNQPAVISTHRLNFVSGLITENHSRNLELFDELLSKIINKWPDVQFMNTVQLGEYYMKNHY